MPCCKQALFCCEKTAHLFWRVNVRATALEAERDELQNEMPETSELMQNSLYENAHIALDQAEYQKGKKELLTSTAKVRRRDNLFASILGQIYSSNQNVQLSLLSTPNFALCAVKISFAIDRPSPETTALFFLFRAV